jgi:uncharacterized protein (TIGR02271 family)
LLDQQEVLASHGSTLIGEDGHKIGTIQDIYLDEQTGAPEWALINTGLLGSKSNFVPLAQATKEGNDIHVPYSKDMVKGAPSMDPDGHLSQSEEAELYRYYGLDYSESRSNSGLPEGGERRAEGYDVSGPTTDDAMTRSEEELHVGTERREAGRARLRKYVVTEQVQTTVPVQREEVRVEREPITDANVDAAMTGPAISEEEHEVVLKEEQPVVEKRAVPRERVRLEKDTVTEERQVTDEVRKEQIETDSDVEAR